MKNGDKTKEALIDEINQLHRRIAQLEESKADQERAKEKIRILSFGMGQAFKGHHDCVP